MNIGRKGRHLCTVQFHDLSGYLKSFGTGISLSELAAATASPDVQGIFSGITSDGQIGEDVYSAALETRELLRQVFRDYFDANDLDAMIFPTTVLPARPIENSLQTVELNEFCGAPAKPGV